MSYAFKVTINITLDNTIDVIAPDGATAYAIGEKFADEVMTELLEATMKERFRSAGDFFCSPVVSVNYEHGDEEVEDVEDWALTPEYLSGKEYREVPA